MIYDWRVYLNVRSQLGHTTTTNNKMKMNQMITMFAVAMIGAGSAFAQTATRQAGNGGPPKTEEERAARKEQCQNANGGACAKGGTCDGQGPGKGAGKCQGKGKGRGACDGSGAGAGGCQTGK